MAKQLSVLTTLPQGPHTGNISLHSPGPGAPRGPLNDPPAADTRQHRLASVSREDTQEVLLCPSPGTSAAPVPVSRSRGSAGLWLAGSWSSSVLSGTQHSPRAVPEAGLGSLG